MRSLSGTPMRAVVLRELYTTVRPRAFGRVLVLAAAAVAGAVLLAALSEAGHGRAAASVGRALFHTYFVAAYALVSIVSAVLGAGAVARDVESGMLEAVGLTHLSPIRYLAGKVTALWLVAAALLAATAPAAAVPLLWGGVSPVELVAGTAVLAIMAILGIATGVAIAARMSAARWSIALAVAAMAPAAALLLGFFAALAGSAGEAWNVPTDGPFWFASIPLADAPLEPLVLAGFVPACAVAVTLGYLAVLAIDPLTPADGRPRRTLEAWLAGALVALVAATAAARPWLEVWNGEIFNAACVLAAGGLGFVALLTRMGPRAASRDGRSIAGVPGALYIVLLSGVGVGLLARVPDFVSTSYPHWIDRGSLGAIAVHAWSFLVLVAGLSCLLQVLLGSRGSPRPALVGIGVVVGVVPFFADVVRHGSPLEDASFAARLSPLYAMWSLRPGGHATLVAPTAALLAAGVCAAALAVVLGRRRSATMSPAPEPR